MGGAAVPMGDPAVNGAVGAYPYGGGVGGETYRWFAKSGVPP